MAASRTAPPVSRVEDTARWVAMARAVESDRPDRLFDDRFARRLAGPEGDALLDGLSGRTGGSWPIVARTVILDRLVMDAVTEGIDAVVNLAAGLDTRPYRLALPSELTFVEIDFAELVDEKNATLADESPRCRLERIALDLADVDARRRCFADLARRFPRILVITEGLLCYLRPEDAIALGRDLLAMRPTRWLTDLHNGAVNRFIAKRTTRALTGTATMSFGPDDGTRVFEELGWRTVRVESTFKTAGAIGRLPFPISWLARLPEKRFGRPGAPWTGVCALEPDRARVG